MRELSRPLRFMRLVRKNSRTGSGRTVTSDVTSFSGPGSCALSTEAGGGAGRAWSTMPCPPGGLVWLLLHMLLLPLR